MNDRSQIRTNIFIWGAYSQNLSKGTRYGVDIGMVMFAKKLF